MDNFVTTDREYGEFLVRFSGDYTKTDVKNANTFTILAPDEAAEFLKRVGKDVVVETSSIKDTIKSVVCSVVAADKFVSGDNVDKAKLNQANTTITKISDNEYTLKCKLSAMMPYFANQQQGTHIWVGIAVQTGETTIIGLKWNGQELGVSDVSEANALSIPAGGIIYWAAMDKGNRAISITKGNKTTAIKFNIEYIK